MRGLSAELATLNCQYATTKAENEQLHTDLRLAEKEVSAMQSVLQHAAPVSFVPVSGSTLFTPGHGMRHCSVFVDPSTGTLTMKINIDGLPMETSRQCSLLTPAFSEGGDDCVDVDLSALHESMQYQ